MVRAEPAQPSARRGKGEKRTKKKEAVVTAIYTIAPYHRTPEQVVAALMRESAADKVAQEGDASSPT